MALCVLYASHRQADPVRFYTASTQDGGSEGGAVQGQAVSVRERPIRRRISVVRVGFESDRGTHVVRKVGRGPTPPLTQDRSCQRL